jgi:SRSO17 transposase
MGSVYNIERMNEDLKGEVGFDHDEGRGWIGWHHHMSVVLCAYALLLGERLAAFPPSAPCHTAPGSHDRAA